MLIQIVRKEKIAYLLRDDSLPRMLHYLGDPKTEVTADHCVGRPEKNVKKIVCTGKMRSRTKAQDNCKSTCFWLQILRWHCVSVLNRKAGSKCIEIIQEPTNLIFHSSKSIHRDEVTFHTLIR